MFKKLLATIILFSSSFIVLGFSINSNNLIANNDDEMFLTKESNYIFANVDEIVNLENIYYVTEDSKIKLSNTTLTSLSSIVISKNSIKASEKGLFEINLNYESINENIYLVVKDSNDREFVLYEKSFDDLANVPSEYNIVSGEVSIFENALQLNGLNSSDGRSIVVLPNYLSNFNNYIIETDIKMLEALNTSRWTSIMFRYETNNYYQMAIRQNSTATNGVEFAAAVNGVWNVRETASFNENLNSNNWYKVKIDVLNQTVKEYINDELLITHDDAKDYNKGNIGFQVNYSKVLFNNIKITLPVEYISNEIPKSYLIPNVYEPETGIINPATVIQEINSESDLIKSLNTVRPATTLVNINSNLDIVDTNNNNIISTIEFIKEIEGKTIPAFRTNDLETAVSLVTLLETELVKDFYLFTETSEIILKARENYYYTRGVLEFNFDETKTNLEETDLINIRNNANKAQATAIIIPNEYISYENVRYLQKRLITVWTKTNNELSQNYNAILSGANGILTNNFNDIFEIYQDFPENSVIRKPFTIAHRGLSSYSENAIAPKDLEPENSVYATNLAIERGAEIIEIDLHITKDNEVVVYHDFNTERFYDKNIDIAQSTLSELKSLNYKYEKFSDTKILTFDEFLSNFKNSDVIFFVEIKSWVRGSIINKVRTVLENNNMMNNSVIISFVDFQIEDTMSIIPELSVGLLDYSGVYTNNKNQTVENVLNKVMPYPTTINHSYPGLSLENVKALSHRGITVWPWTINNKELDKYFMMGVGGNTSDTLSYYNDAWLGFELNDTKYTYDLNDKNQVTIMSKQTTINGKEYEMVPDYQIIDDGGTGIVLDKGKVVSANKTGVVSILVSMKTKLPDQTPIVLFNNLVTINIIDTTPVKSNNTHIYLFVAVGVLAIAATTIMYLTKRKRRK